MRRELDWPDATTILAEHLVAAGYTVRWAVPSPRPDEFLVVRRVGSGAPSTYLDEARMDVECWSGGPSDDPKPAHELAASVRADILALPASDAPVTKTRISNVVAFNDPQSNSPRVLIACSMWLKPEPTQS